MRTIWQDIRYGIRMRSKSPGFTAIALGTLASGTSLAILIVFAMVNAALWRLKERSQPDDVPNLWKAVPILGLTFCVLTIAGQVILWATGLGGG